MKTSAILLLVASCSFTLCGCIPSRRPTSPESFGESAHVLYATPADWFPDSASVHSLSNPSARSGVLTVDEIELRFSNWDKSTGRYESLWHAEYRDISNWHIDRLGASRSLVLLTSERAQLFQFVKGTFIDVSATRRVCKLLAERLPEARGAKECDN